MVSLGYFKERLKSLDKLKVSRTVFCFMNNAKRYLVSDDQSQITT